MKTAALRHQTIIPAIVALCLGAAAAAHADGGDDHACPEPSWVAMVAAASIPAGMAAMRKTMAGRFNRSN